MQPETLQHRLDRLKQGYSEAGLPMTMQRRALLEVLAGREDHPTVDQLFEELSARIPEVSRTTVYRSLEVLEGLGILTRVEHPGSSVRYDPNPDPHHHFVCNGCGSLTDLSEKALEGASALRFVSSDGVAEDISVMVRGRCSQCIAQTA